MKKAFGIAVVSAALATACIQSANALDTTNTWRGGVLVTSVTAACDLQGYPEKGQTLMAVFRPRFVNTDPLSAFLVTFANGALLVTPTDPAIPTPDSGSYTGLLIGGLATGGSYTGGTYDITTSNVTPTVGQVNVTGTITKFRNTAGCTLKFKGGLIRGVLQ